jgi:DNA-binding transcriptional regulator LsrR (DeoR family)
VLTKGYNVINIISVPKSNGRGNIMKININALNELMKEEKLNRSEFAKELGLNRITISRLLNEKRPPSGVVISAFKNRFPNKSIDDYFFCN